MTYFALLRPCGLRLGCHLLAGVMLSIALVCGACSPAEPATAVYADPSVSIEVRQGETFIISLADEPMNGLMWEAEYDDSIMTLISEELVYPEDRDCTRCAWGYYQFTFDAESEGNCTVACTYRRPGFPASTDEVRTFNVAVSSS